MNNVRAMQALFRLLKIDLNLKELLMNHLNRRHFVKTGLAAGVLSAMPLRTSFANRANEEIGLGTHQLRRSGVAVDECVSKDEGVNITAAVRSG
ncbi:MAG: hypothetical protein R3C28_24120 [Pirellulaceae bacterium]